MENNINRLKFKAMIKKITVTENGNEIEQIAVFEVETRKDDAGNDYQVQVKKHGWGSIEQAFERVDEEIQQAEERKQKAVDDVAYWQNIKEELTEFENI